MSVTVTLHAWWLLVYLAIGVVLWLPLEWRAWRSSHMIAPFWTSFRSAVRRDPWVVVLTILLWPLAAWEALS